MSEKTYLPNDEPLKSYADINYLDLDQHQHIWKHIVDSHPFNRALTVFLPSCSINVATEHMNQNLGSYYQIESTLDFLLEPNFFQQYIKSDQCQLIMHSIDTNINTDDVVVFSPSGTLYFSLLKQTFETFGIEASARSKADKKHDKHVAVVNLNSSDYMMDSKSYNRLKWCFENTMKSTFKLHICAIDTVYENAMNEEQNRSGECPSTDVIQSAKGQSISLNYNSSSHVETGTTLDINFPSTVNKISKQEMQAEFEAVTDINIPSFEKIDHSMDQRPENWDNDAMQALEWLGLAHLKANRIKQRKEKVDPFVSVYQPPAPLLQDCHTGTLVKFKGFIPTTCIQNIMTVVRKMMASDITSQWTSLTCWGYKDSPFTWNKIGHYEYLNSENDYTLLLLPNKKTAYIYQMYGSHHTKF